MDDLSLLSDISLFLKEKKAEGVKIVAYLAHDNIPEELLDAAGFFPLRLIFGGNDELMDASHDFLPPSTCAFAQSCIGLFSTKPSSFNFLDLIDYFIVSNHCVSDVCVSEIISKYFNIPRLNFYVPYTKHESSLKYYKLELLELKNNLEDIIGIKITNAKLAESIRKYNQFKKVLLEVNELEILGSEKLKILHRAMLYGPEFQPDLEKFIQYVKDNPARLSESSKDVLFTGCSIFINDNMVDLIEEGGGNIVFFDTWIGNQYYSQILDEKSIKSEQDPLDLLVLKFKNNVHGDHSVPNFLEHKIALIEKYYQDYTKIKGKKLGIINHIIKFCDHISLMSSFLKDKLQDKGIQVLNLERDYSRANRGQLSTRIEAYLEMM
ncbi:MAG: 2-hydroxyacyl-CoA dehydratase subunit D [Promethearchaeota archaeon]|jgi:benzoyl-CoA reductase/2-hydroxyglutaryl-CoA dehydratase subunit BcrC/BadD/HgdB